MGDIIMIGEGDYYNDRPDVEYSEATRRPQDGRYSQMTYEAPPMRRSYGVPVIAICACIVVGLLVFFFVMSSGDGYKPGKTTGYTYRNEYFGVRIHVDSDMITQGYVGRESRVIHRLKKKKEVVTEFQGKNLEGTKELTFDVAYMDKDMDDINSTEKEMAEGYKASFVASMEDPSLDIKVEDKTLDLAGKTRYGYIMTASGGNEKAYIGQFYFFKGRYSAVLTVFGTSKAEVESMLKDGITGL